LFAELLGDKKQKGHVEETAEKKITMHTEEYLLTVRDLVSKCYSSASSDRYHALLDLLKAVSLAIYCSRGENFGSKFVKGELVGLGMDVLESHKIYSMLQE
jgi:hypothetical protein